jgi:autotransporter-associated beta strand protein
MFTRAQLCTLLGLILAAAPEMYAQTTYTWTGNSSGDLNTGHNWVGNVAPPNDGTATLAFGPASNNYVTPVSSFNAYQLTFNGSDGFYEFYTPSATSVTLGLGSGGLVGGGGSVAFYGSGPGAGLNLRLNASQTWATNGYLAVYAPISGDTADTLTMSGTGSLTLSADNTFSGGLTVASGTLYLGNSSTSVGSTIVSGPVGTGTLTLQNGTTLSSAYYSGDITLANNLSLDNNVTFGSPNSYQGNSGQSLTLTGLVTTSLNTITTHLASDLTLFIKGTLDGPANTSITFDPGTSSPSNQGGVVVLAGTTTNHITSLIANSAGIVFASPNAIPASGSTIQALNGGYVGVGIVDPLHIPSAVTVLNRITDKADFNGTFGFDTDPALTAPPAFTEALNFSGFINSNFRIGSATTAVLASTATITPPGSDYAFGGGNGLLRVESNLTNNDAAPRTLTVSSPNGESLTLWLAGTNSFTGGITLDNSLLRIAYAYALPTTGNIVIPSTSRGYLGFDYDLNPTALAALGLRLIATNATLVLGFDSTSPTSSRTIESPIDLNAAGFPAGTVLGTTTNLRHHHTSRRRLRPLAVRGRQTRQFDRRESSRRHARRGDRPAEYRWRWRRRLRQQQFRSE